MDTKWKNYSHAVLMKVVVFVLVVLCFTGLITAVVNIAVVLEDDFNIISQDSYFQSRSYARESESILMDLTRLIVEYKNEEHILKGGTISEEEIRREEVNLFEEFQYNSRMYNPKLSQVENYENFKKEYVDKISQVKDRMIKDDLREFNLLLQRLQGYEGFLYYASDGVNVFTNTSNIGREQFKSHPAYMIFENYQRKIYPNEIKENKYLYWITENFDRLDPKSTVLYLAFPEEVLNLKIKEWQENKVIATNNLYRLAGFLLGLILFFGYLVLVIGRKSFKDQELHLNAIDRLYNDLKVLLCLLLIPIWAVLLEALDVKNIPRIIIPITIPIATVGLVLVLSLVKHIKNRTIIKHTLLYTIISKLFKFTKDVYDSGNLGVKTVIIVIGYPLLVGLSLFLFPVTLGLAAWFSFKRIKAFNALKEGVERIKAGDIHYRIDVDIDGEFARLAASINSITDGLKKAVDNELKSERLKTELITNVSHDIRTPLTSIITYVDLLKKEKDPAKVEEYIEVLDQKSKRLKVLTDDLFEVAKASSGNIPVNLERIDIVALITQGLGEVNAKIEALKLEFKLNHPKDKVYVTADGKLLWRSIENLLSNIFKYALKGSRVYIDIENLDNQILVTFKNISAYELNIPADELMERFTRGDESRSSQGSGLGLAIAKSLIDAQRGKFVIQVDGDLFKAMIYMPKYKNSNE